MPNDTVPPAHLQYVTAVDARLDALTAALQQAQHEIDALRRRRQRPSAWIVALLLTVATSTFALGLSAQSAPLQSGSFWAPFEVFGCRVREVMSAASRACEVSYRSARGADGGDVDG